MKNRGGRPSTNTWVAIVNYWELDENGEANGKGKTLMNHDADDPSKKLYWPNMAAAIAGLEALQIDGPIKYVIFLKFNNAEFSMKPEEQLHIKYKHAQEEIKELEEKKEEVPKEDLEEKKETTNEIVDDLQNKNQENQELLDNADDKDTKKELPEIGDDD